MNNLTITPKFGDFLLKNGQYTSQNISADQVKAFILPTVFLWLTFLPTKDVSQSRQLVSRTRRLYCLGQNFVFHLFNLDEINRRRGIIGQKPLPQDLLAWSTGRLQGSGYGLQLCR